MRTVGALLVACFHIWGGRVSGGVDVFFVVSGFLITGSLARELHSTQTIDVIAFWGRIAKRVAPMAYVILGLTLLASLLWLPQSRQEGFLAETIFSALYLENVKLMHNAVDYLAREEAPSPVQQFWALSVQVQFYAVWPFLLLATAATARRLRLGASSVIGTLSLVLLASLAYSVIVTVQDPEPAYFNTFARVWEFAFGGLVAVALPHLALPRGLRFVAGWLGLLLIVSCGFVLPPSMHFPGFVALWPTLGAVLVLLAGGEAERKGALRLLSLKPLVACGEISFSFYLWHWPVLIFAMLLTGRTHLGLWHGLAVIGIALAGAYATYRFVEKPILKSSALQGGAWKPHAVGLAMVMPVLVSAVIWMALLGRGESSTGLSLTAYPGGRIPAALETMLTPDASVMPNPAVAKRDIARVYRDKCHQKQKDATVIECIYGVKEGAEKTIALVGGSHSAHWLPALEVLAQQHGWRIVNITKSSCPFAGGYNSNAACMAWNEGVIASLARLKPDVVFTTSTRRRSAAGKNEEFIPESYPQQWARLAQHGVHVLAVRDNPWMNFRVPECVEKNASNPMACSRPRSKIMSKVDPASELSPKPANVTFIDLTDRFCDQDTCYPVSGNVLIYSDKHHITATFSRSLADVLGQRMQQVRPDLFTTQEHVGTARM